MKKTYLIFTFIILSFQFVFSQEYEIKQEAKQLIESRSIYLNGGLRASFGGKSRIYLKVDLPPNTIKWYYSFSTKKGKSGTQNMNLGLQLAGMLVDPSGLTSNTLSAIKVPDGVATADIYLCDRANIDAFLEKVDNYGGTFYYNMEGTTLNTKQAVVEIDDITSGTIYLGLKNPSTNDGLNISIEVVAVTETKTLKEKPEKQQKAELYGRLGWIQFEKGNYEKCIEYCNKANTEFELGWVFANKGLAQLMIDYETEAMETYINAITLIKKQPKSNYIFGEMIKDIDNALKIKSNLRGAEEIKQLIKMQR
jgi:tetratricopeptide (TPR) repeat protein